MNFKRKLAILAVPSILAVAGGAIAVHAANTPGPSTPSSANESATENQAEDTVTTSGTAEAADPAGDVQSGHADTGDQVDHQATGNE